MHVEIVDARIAEGDARVPDLIAQNKYEISVSSEMMTVQQKLPETRKEAWDLLIKSQQDLVDALLLILFSGWSKVFLKKIEGADFHLVRQLNI